MAREASLSQLEKAQKNAESFQERVEQVVDQLAEIQLQSVQDLLLLLREVRGGLDAECLEQVRAALHRLLEQMDRVRILEHLVEELKRAVALGRFLLGGGLSDDDKKQIHRTKIVFILVKTALLIELLKAHLAKLYTLHLLDQKLRTF